MCSSPKCPQQISAADLSEPGPEVNSVAIQVLGRPGYQVIRSKLEVVVVVEVSNKSRTGWVQPVLHIFVVQVSPRMSHHILHSIFGYYFHSRWQQSRKFIATKKSNLHNRVKLSQDWFRTLTSVEAFPLLVHLQGCRDVTWKRSLYLFLNWT